MSESKPVVEEKVTDEQMKNAHHRFPVQTPTSKEEFYEGLRKGQGREPGNLEMLWAVRVPTRS